MKVRFKIAIATAAATALALTGCGTQGSESNKSDSNGDASTLISQSAEAMKNVTSAHIVLTADGKVPNLKVTKLEADVAGKPAVVATGEATVQMGQETQTAKLIYVDGHLYSDIAVPGQWFDYGDGNSIYNLSVIFDPSNGLANALSNLKDPKVEGSETINGTPTTKIAATASTNDVAVLAGARKAPEKPQDWPITVWIAESDPHNLVQAQINVGDASDAKVTMTLSDFGKTVTAEKPEITPPN
ncbi:LppX_LprAFG lipoprotein [Mycolicibacterium farcinogenes]|nr:LppX_LprAFG lipoprotein [Mycolicibacterium farcinogenes]